MIRAMKKARVKPKPMIVYLSPSPELGRLVGLLLEALALRRDLHWARTKKLATSNQKVPQLCPAIHVGGLG